VNLHVDREGSNVVISGTNEKGDTITLVGTLDRAGSMMMLKYLTNGSPGNASQMMARQAWQKNSQ
jgi:hypothetical protein